MRILKTTMFLLKLIPGGFTGLLTAAVIAGIYIRSSESLALAVLP